MNKDEKELAVFTMLREHGVSSGTAIIAISEMWSEQDLDEMLALPQEKMAEIARDIVEMMGE